MQRWHEHLPHQVLDTPDQALHLNPRPWLATQEEEGLNERRALLDG